jgi:hypothetical protein
MEATRAVDCHLAADAVARTADPFSTRWSRGSLGQIVLFSNSLIPWQITGLHRNSVTHFWRVH